jgi:hypothetical protein
MATWKPEVKQFFVASKTKKTKKGKPVMFPVTHRKLYVLDKTAFMDSGDYRIVMKTETSDNNGVVVKTDKFTISVIPRIAQSCWTNPTGKCETWYTYPPDKADGSRPYKRTDDKPMTYDQILAWLTAHLGKAQAELALFTMLTATPENLAA